MYPYDVEEESGGTRASRGNVSSLVTSVSIAEEHSTDPVSVFCSLREQFPGETFLLESVEGSRRTARYSFIGVDPISTFTSMGRKVEVDGWSRTCDEPYEELRRYVGSIRCGASDLAPFSGGLVGYVGYGMVRYFENIRQPKGAEDGLPDMYFVLPRHLVCIDHLNSRTLLITHGRMEELKSALRRTKPAPLLDVAIGEGRSNTTEGQYHAMVEKAKDRIHDGEIFQTVLSRRMDFGFEGESLQMYKALRRLNPSPYLFHLDFGKTKLLGSSPEMLVRLEGEKLTTRPLAGTRPRASDPEEDEKLKLEMLLDEKERAEHLMLVDLHRNDMGRVSRFGTVKVNELMSVEKYSHVQHIVSNVESRISEDRDGFDALKACFPAGTVSGAPKIRAMDIISELEVAPRGPYAGAVGYFDFTGNMDFCITIRSIVVSGNRASVQAGAGIVADSVPEREYAETEHKMGAMLQAISSSVTGGG
ncbi:MAG: anthranilate synthase component I family protein [Methanobacteriota archaeon]|nr:MAG: anthranilate synthase component I family protein [Euryarchaeota archaeon]